MMWAASYGQLDVVRFLVHKGTDVNAVNEVAQSRDGRTQCVEGIQKGIDREVGGGGKRQRQRRREIVCMQ